MLIKDLEPNTPQEYILKGVVNATIGQMMGSREHLTMAQKYFQLVRTRAHTHTRMRACAHAYCARCRYTVAVVAVVVLVVAPTRESAPPCVRALQNPTRLCVLFVWVCCVFSVLRGEAGPAPRPNSIFQEFEFGLEFKFELESLSLTPAAVAAGGRVGE